MGLLNDCADVIEQFPPDVRIIIGLFFPGATFGE